MAHGGLVLPLPPELHGRVVDHAAHAISPCPRARPVESYWYRLIVMGDALVFDISAPFDAVETTRRAPQRWREKQYLR